MTRPFYYPKSCPPANASQPTDVIVFRFIQNGKPQHKDFLSFKELNPNKSYNDKECESCGLSVFTDSADVQKAKAVVPRLRKMTIAKATLKNGDGEILHTPSNMAKSHHTWWKYETIDVTERFVVIHDSYSSQVPC